MPTVESSSALPVIGPPVAGSPLPERADAPVCLSRQIEARAARTPDAIALVFGRGQWTLGTLNARANRLARLLRSAGVGPETIVAVCLERGPDLWVALLAVLKAGGAYLPLDPSTPAGRLEFVLGDAGAGFVLADTGLIARLALPAGTVALCPRAEAERIAAQPDTDPGFPISPTDLAYVIYTSGSTGRPKGVMVERRSIVAEMAWELRALGIDEHDRILMRTPVSFDGASLGLWAPLIAGATGVMLDEHALRDPRAIVDAVRRHGVTVMSAVPSLLTEILGELERDPAPTTIRCLVAGGEALPAAAVRRWARLSSAPLYNFYGPTECTVNSTCYRCPAEGVEDPVPIGRPTDATSVHLLDPDGQPVPAGAVGELWIGGAGVARGYLNRPELTAERFVPVPSPDAPDARLYRTGDLARMRCDGEIEYVGRADEQFKFRGYRIEPGEIEAALRALPAVRAAAVALRTHPVAGPQLIAYVVRAQPQGGEGALDEAALRAALRRTLPEHMVPGAVVELDAMPMLPSGKLDRQALPEPGEAAPGAPGHEAQWACETQRRVAAVWTEVLGRPVLRPDDDFFELGGHSMLAARANARLRERYGVDLPLRVHFAAPTVAGFAERVDEALRTRDEPGVDAALERGDPLAAAPATDAQAALLFVESLGEPDARYHVALTTRIDGSLALDALRAAVAATLGAHRALRTAFTLRDGVAEQQVLELAPPAVELVDLSVDGVAPPPAEVEARLREHAAQPFDTARPPLARAAVFRLAARCHVLQIVIHHLVTDGWSMGLIARDVAERYRVLESGGRCVEPAPALEYVDYARWRARTVDAAARDEALAWWCDELAGVEPLALPPAAVPPRPGEPEGGLLEFEIDPSLAARLARLGKHRGATPFVVLLAAYQILLMRYSGQHDFAVGSPVACRDRVEFEGLVGYFVNMISLRTEAADDLRFDAFLARTRERVLDALGHREVPFDRVVAALRAPREQGRNPVFQASFALQNVPEALVELPGLDCRPQTVDTGTRKFDLSMSIVERGGRLAGRLEYARGSFDAAGARRLLEHYERLLQAIVAAPEAPVGELALFDAAERGRVVDVWNMTDRPYPAESTLAELFERAAAQAGRATAVIDGSLRISYADLNARANRLAHHLRAFGVGPDSMVAMVLPRGIELVVAVLGIVKAGGAYLPLDPAYPADRIALMVGDAGPAAFIGTVATLEALGPAVNAPAIAVDRDASTIRAWNDANPQPAGDAGSIAYVNYTSGSTGRPKGVMVTQRNVVRLVCGTDYFHPQSDECIAFASNVSFDAATFEIWGALLNGAALAVVDRDALLSASALREQIARDRITTMFLTTALFNALAASQADAFAGLRTLMFGGEAADPASVHAVVQAGAPARLLNVYGPTETTTFATWHEIPRERILAAGPDGGPIPIGRPIANTRCYVLDAAMRPVPVGIVGELFIGGPGVAAGYLGQPELSAARFVADPFRGDGRLYRTGDRVRWRDDGEIEFVGRVDAQVKIRGFRIEPGEIEHALRDCAGVSEALVLVERDASGEGRILAFALGDPDGGEAALRACLRERLPAYMMPARIVVVGTWPLTPNGKLDRQALRALCEAGAGAEPVAGGPDEAAGETEARVLAIWRDALGVPGIGANDDFFDVGGHSILAVKMLAEVETAFGVRIRPARLFQAPTARRFARLIDELREADPARVTEDRSCVVTIRAEGSRAPLVFLSGYGGAVIVFDALARALGPDQPLYVLDIGAFGIEELRASSLEQIAARMLADLRAVRPDGPYALAGYSLGGKFAWEIAQQLRRDGLEPGLLCLLDCFAPGYPRRRSLAGRVGLLGRQLLRDGPLRVFAHAREHIDWQRRTHGGRDDESIFGDEGAAIVDAAIARDLQASASASLAMWRRYVPARYEGRLTLIAAEHREERARYVDDDPLLGWEPLVPAGIERISMACHHRRMLDPDHAGMLAALLGPLLEALPRRPG